MPAHIHSVDPLYGFPTNLDTRKLGVFLIEVIFSDPVGDPDSGRPCIDRGQFGRISDRSTKRLVRELVAMAYGEKLFQEEDTDLSETQEAYKGSDAQKKIMEDHWDIPVFGAVLTAKNLKSVTGPVSVGNAFSIDIVHIVDNGLTRAAHVKNKANMGSCPVVHYGLYRLMVSYHPLKKSEYLTPRHLEMFWAGLIEGWENHRAANRQGVNLRYGAVFNFATARGNGASYTLAERIQAVSSVEVPTSTKDYTITADFENLPDGMTVHTWDLGVTWNNMRALAAK